MSNECSYLLHVHDNDIGTIVSLDGFPELHIYYVANKNTVCPVYYGNSYVRCASPGNASITLCINKYNDIVISALDEEENHATVLGEYEFVGRGIHIVNESKELTYLLFTITRYLVSSGSNSGKYGTETRSYRVGEIFMLEFTESGGNGYTWQLELPKGESIELLENVYIPHCSETDKDDQGPMCVNSHRFLFKAIKSGQHFINAAYRRWWEEDELNRKENGKTRQYKITIL